MVADAAVSYKEEGSERPTKAGGRSKSLSLCSLQLELHRPQFQACTSPAAFTFALISLQGSPCTACAHMALIFVTHAFRSWGYPPLCSWPGRRSRTQSFQRLLSPTRRKARARGRWHLRQVRVHFAFQCPCLQWIIEGWWGCIKAGRAGRALRIALKLRGSAVATNRSARQRKWDIALPSCWKLKLLLFACMLLRPGIRSSAAAGQRP